MAVNSKSAEYIEGYRLGMRALPNQVHPLMWSNPYSRLFQRAKRHEWDEGYAQGMKDYDRGVFDNHIGAEHVFDAARANGNRIPFAHFKYLFHNYTEDVGAYQFPADMSLPPDRLIFSCQPMYEHIFRKALETKSDVTLDRRTLAHIGELGGCE